MELISDLAISSFTGLDGGKTHFNDFDSKEKK